MDQKVKPAMGGCSCEAIAALGQEYGYMVLSAYEIDVRMVQSDLWHRHSLAKQFRTRTGCSTSCGTESCRPGDKQLYGEGKHEEFVREIAQRIARHSGNITLVSSDHVDLKLLVASGKVSTPT